MKIKIIEVKEMNNIITVDVEIDSRPKKVIFPKSYKEKDPGTKKPFWIHELKSMFERTDNNIKTTGKRVNNSLIGKEFELGTIEDLSPKALFQKCKERDLKYLNANKEKLNGEFWTPPKRTYNNTDSSVDIKIIKIDKK